MPSILNLKFKGNKSFVAFSNLADTDSLTTTWKVCSKVASYLEQGSRLENLSWRLWHLQNLMVDTDNAKSKREFKKLSKCMGDKLDKEKGRSIEELEAPDFKRNHSTDMIRQRAVEKERNREASQNAKPGTIKRMQFTFSIDQPSPATFHSNVRKPDMRPSAEFKESTKRGRPSTRAAANMDDSGETADVEEDANDKDPPLTQRGRRHQVSAAESNQAAQQQSLHFPSIFSDNFSPSALLYPAPTRTNPMNYGEGVGFNPDSDGFSISRPTIEIPLDDLVDGVEMSDVNDGPETWTSYGTHNTPRHHHHVHGARPHRERADVVMSDHSYSSHEDNDGDDDASSDSQDADYSPTMHSNVPPLSQTVKEVLPQTVSPAKIGRGSGTGASTPMGRPSLTVRTQATPVTRSSGPGATATSVNPAVLRHTGNNNSAPGGVKAECSNCGATHTPLWRRGLNDELNCNACGLYCKLHKRPRPKSMRNTHGEGRAQAAPRQEAVDVMAQCYNCHTTATPLWRKDDEGKTVCNACGLYYKLHGSARPISMKSDVIRKRSRHDARRMGHGVSDTPSASPGASRRTSPSAETSPTLAPDGTTQITYDSYDESDFRSSQSELMGALGAGDSQTSAYNSQGASSHIYNPFPGPYHPDYLMQNAVNAPADPLPFASVDSSDMENLGMSPRTSKRRRMSVDSASEPPSSAVSYNSYNDGYSSSSTTSRSARSSMDFPFNFYPSYPPLRGSGNTFWHPPMLPQDNSPQFVHPPMLPADESPMDYLHPPMLPQDEDSLFATYLHPPMMLPNEESSTAAVSSPRPHPPMFPSDSVYTGGAQGHGNSQDQSRNQHQSRGHGHGQTDFYDSSAMQTY
ncbi:hypothetical protein PLICRDRAFT_174876 [Plicaturopsis crispa FD-325 SS-3]|nr:hypothetical protein PLICRDRAFT_174876 [Plicaturopsis crispa FD-325 SS-3]